MAQSQFKHLGFVTAAITAVLIASNVSAVKLIQLGPFAFDGGTFLFPLAYIFGDVLTEVYGYKASRRVIWTAFLWLAIVGLSFQAVIAAPAAEGDLFGDAFAIVLSTTPRIFLASLVAYVCGEFVNSYVLARMKVWTNGSHLWTRTIGSTIFGQAVDTLIFMLIAFAFVFPWSVWWTILISGAIFKVVIEVVFTPFTYIVVNWLKREEGVDIYDTDTNFNPFALRDA
jgi:uncharacterized integral membrane protein (TIGR00697 family)